MNRSFGAPVLSLLALFAAASPAGAIIVGGTSGTGNNNNTEAGLQSYLSTTSYGSFDYWNNLVAVNDASGVYLGYNAGTGNGWVLAALHVGTPANITVAGVNYLVTNSQAVSGTDLLLIEISGVANTAAGVLPSINLAGTAATMNEFVLMTGRGFTTSSSYPYPHGTTTNLESQGMRWGTNRVNTTESVTIGSTTSNAITLDFDSPFAIFGPGAVTAYEGQVSGGDSGGGLFAYRGGEWVLAGIGYYGASASGNSAQYGDGSGYTDVFSYNSGITAITGTLIPEPSAALLLPMAGGLALRRRRR